MAFAASFAHLILRSSSIAPQQNTSKSRKICIAKASGGIRYVPFADAEAADAVVVDCTHPSLPTFTHHKAHKNPPGIRSSDTSTGLVLNAIEDGIAADWFSRPAVAVNHFDGDALFSAWAFLHHRTESLKHSEVLRAAALLHDFRELPSDANGNISLDAHDALGRRALALCCWINTVERQRFTPPYEDKDSDDKFEYFLRELGPFLENPEAYRTDWVEEYDRVLEDLNLIAEKGQVRRYNDIGVAVIESPRPAHYYALFSNAVGCDVVVSLYGGTQPGFEVEERYTQFVNFLSRPVQGRLDMGPLAAALNRSLDPHRCPGTSWSSPRYIDTGPLLRLDISGEKLPKQARYGHPTARPMHASGLTPAQFEAVVVGYFRYGLRGVEPRLDGWPWEALSDLNTSIEWELWERSLPAVIDVAS